MFDMLPHRQSGGFAVTDSKQTRSLDSFVDNNKVLEQLEDAEHISYLYFVFRVDFSHFLL